jgi:glutathionyl-hydroquinone reductase
MSRTDTTDRIERLIQKQNRPPVLTVPKTWCTECGYQWLIVGYGCPAHHRTTYQYRAPERTADQIILEYALEIAGLNAGGKP